MLLSPGGGAFCRPRRGSGFATVNGSKWRTSRLLRAAIAALLGVTGAPEGGPCGGPSWNGDGVLNVSSGWGGEELIGTDDFFCRFA
jgi:hypothetical protein